MQQSNNFSPQRINETNNFEIKKIFNELENSLFDLKISLNNDAKSNLENSNLNKFISFSSINNTAIDSENNYNKILCTKPNGEINHLATNVNDQLIEKKYNENVSYNLNNNLINQSYEYAKLANEFKEKLNDVYTALNYYTKAIELNPYEFRFYCNRSICLQQANRLPEALEDANSAINLMPNARKPYIRKAEILALLNKYNDAENILKFCLKLENANDISTEVVQEEIQKLIKTVITKCGISSNIIKQAIHCTTIEEAIDFAFSKQIELKLNSYKYNNEKNFANVIRSENGKGVSISKSLETIDYFTDEESNNLTPNRKLSANEELFNFNNLQSPLKKESFNFNYTNNIENITNKQLIPLNTNYLYNKNNNMKFPENTTPTTNMNGHQNYPYSNHNIPVNRKRNSVSLSEPLDNLVKTLNFDRFSQSSFIDTNFNLNNELVYNKSLRANSNPVPPNLNLNYSKNFCANSKIVEDLEVDPKYKETAEKNNFCTNLIGYKGLWLGNVSSSCSRERLISIFRKYGDPIVHQLKQSPCVFIKYNNEKSPTDAIQDLHGKILIDIVHNKNEPIRLHFECNRRQQEENFPKDKTPRVFKNGECYFWRTVGCGLGKKCPKIHIPINEKIDFQMWMLNDNNHKMN